jgi:hypothetical protein
MRRWMAGVTGAVVSAGVLLGVLSRPRQEEPKEGFACALHALSAEERVRHGVLSARLTAAIRARTEIADGYVFTVDESVMDWSSLGEWARAERLCCPFFRVALRAQPRGGGLELELGGAPGVKRFIRSELPVILARG